MMTKIETPDYWENRYINKQTGWDMKSVSPPLKHYIDQLSDKKIKILIPGAGNAYEAEYLFNKGFKNIYVVDFAKSPLQNLKSRISEFPINNLIQSDFFELQGQFDLILEQTFFCALPPNRRLDYVEKVEELLKPKAKLVGVLFDFPLTENGPPFGGDIDEYKNYFKYRFDIRVLERCYNSHPSRNGKELFINLVKN